MKDKDWNPPKFEGVKEIGNPITFAKKYFKDNAEVKEKNYCYIICI